MSGGKIGPEKLDLKWFDFQANAGTAFKNLRSSSDFSDVTLVSGDGQQVEAHKMILASSSSFFRNILEGSKHPRPLIYMRGINLVDLTALVDFIYFGETSVKHGNIEAFLALAKELGLKGVESTAKEEIAFDPLNGEDFFDVDQNIKPCPDKAPPQSPLDRKVLSSDDAREMIETSDIIESTESVVRIGENKLMEHLEELQEKTDSSETGETNQEPIAANCHQALSVKDAVKLIQRKNCGSVCRIPPKPESGTVWRFQTDRC